VGGVVLNSFWENKTLVAKTEGKSIRNGNCKQIPHTNKDVQIWIEGYTEKVTGDSQVG
jgi:hypothetical protein